MGESAPRVGAVVLARDRPEPTAATIDALLGQDPPPDRIVLVDNDGTPEVRSVLEDAAARHRDADVLRLGHNHGCAGGFERGLERVLRHPSVDFVVGFDDDATPMPGCVAALAAAATTYPNVGAVGAVAHDPAGTLAWPTLVDGTYPVHTLADVEALAERQELLPVPNLAWHGLMFPVEVLRRHGLVWGDLFLQYEDIELGLRFRRNGLRSYLVPGAECLHPAPPPARHVRVLGRQIDVTAQNPAKEYLTLRNGLVVRHRHEGLRFWYGTGPLVLLRGLLSALALDVPKRSALRHVFVRGILDAVTGRLGPPPRATVELGAHPPTRRQ